MTDHRTTWSSNRTRGASDTPADGTVVELTATTYFWGWQLHARCRNIGSETFFGYVDETTSNRLKRERDAITICRQCVVRLECLTHAQTTPEQDGIWGGLTEKERRKIRLESNSQRKSTRISASPPPSPTKATSTTPPTDRN
jgi:WhiB family redox-sensing transcriptional regulator